MYNCIFTPHCLDITCDRSCPKYAEVSNLLDRNDIGLNSNVFRASKDEIQNSIKLLDDSNGSLGCYECNAKISTISKSELITYCAICQNWQGSQLHCTVYNLRFSNYIDELKKSWTAKSEPEALEYMRIWSTSSKVLVISHLDYVNFKDFESQTLLNLIQTRTNTSQTTIIVSPKIDKLIGDGVFFERMKSVLKGVSRK